MKLKALPLAVFLATISYSYSTNSTAKYEPSKSPADTRNSSTQQHESHTTLPTKKSTKPSRTAGTIAASTLPAKFEQTTTKSILKSKTTKGRKKPTHKTGHRTTGPGKTTATRKKPLTTASTPYTTPKPDIPCEMRNESCSACLKGDSCVYCDSDDTCKKNKGKIIPSGCKGNKWYWKQCKIPGNILIIVIPTVGGVLLIMLGCCIYCCCCRRCSKNRAAREESRQQQRRADRQERNSERRENRRARHDAIRMKYGLLQNMDDDDDEIDPVA